MKTHTMKTQETKTHLMTIIDKLSPPEREQLLEMERKERIDENDPLNLVLDHAHTINREHAENISNMVKDLLQTVKEENEKCVKACTDIAHTVSIEHGGLVYNAQKIREMLDEKLDPILVQLINIDDELGKLSERIKYL